MNEDALLERITTNPAIFGGKPLIRGMRIAVEHEMGIPAGGDTPERPLRKYPFLEPTDIQAWPANRCRTGSQEPRHHEIPAGCMRFVAHPSVVSDLWFPVRKKLTPFDGKPLIVLW